MTNLHYDRRTLKAGYWVLNNYHYGFVAEAHCNLEFVNTVNLYKTANDHVLYFIIEFSKAIETCNSEISIALANGSTVALTPYTKYACIRGNDQMIRCELPVEIENELKNENGFTICFRQENSIKQDFISTEGAVNIISNAIRHKSI
ncbi:MULTISPECIES: hypothetical protein [Vibrio]|uniref:hypothetical protein n=1 Tax=Vibrio TaxID=662 RepID=UPI003D126412